MGCVMARGQDYIPLIGENKVWSVSHEKFTFLGDTIINDSAYAKLFYHNFIQEFTPDSLEYVAALREDTINKKVYFVWKDYNTEVLLYDFSLNVGDTFHAQYPEFSFSGPTYFVHSINPRYLDVSRVTDSIIEGKSRKVLVMANHYSYDIEDYFIEGIGSRYGIIYAGYELEMDREYPFLLCLHENNTLVYQEEDPYSISQEDPCYSIPTTSVDESINNNLELTISSTLIDEKLSILSNAPLNEITILNLNGRNVYQYRSSENITQLSINVAHWDSGLYIVRAGNSQHFVSKKIVKL